MVSRFTPHPVYGKLLSMPYSQVVNVESTPIFHLAHCLRMLPIQHSFSFRLPPFLLVFVPFRINVARERVLELERCQIDKEDLNGQKCSGWSPIQ